MPLAPLSAGFQSLPLLPTTKLGPSGADSQVGWFVCLSNKLSCEAGSFSHCCLNPHRCFQSEVLRLYFPGLEPWVAWSVSLPICFSWFIFMEMWDLPVCQATPCSESSPPTYPSPPLLPIWMNVSSLTPWLLDFHTV